MHDWLSLMKNNDPLPRVNKTTTLTTHVYLQKQQQQQQQQQQKTDPMLNVLDALYPVRRTRYLIRMASYAKTCTNQ